MDYQQYLKKKKKFQSDFLEFINNEENIEEKFQNIMKLLIDNEIKEDINEFRLFLHFVNSTSNNLFRTKNFFPKFEKILLIFKEEFAKNFSDNDIFSIFQNNRRILLFLIENNLLSTNKLSQSNLLNFEKSKEYFSKANKEGANKEEGEKIEENLKNGENEQEIAEIIRNDKISEFIVYINKNEIQIKTKMKKSIYETNSFLLGKTPTLIEYSAFFGSIQIFRYLFKNNVELNSSLWIYAIHGGDPEIIHILEENGIKPKDATYKECITESLKCHQNEIVNYIRTNIISKEKLSEIDEFIENESIKYYNYCFFPENDSYNMNNFYLFCKFDYFFFVENCLKNRKVDVNFKTNDYYNDHKCFISTPLFLSISYDNYSIAELLLKQKDIDVNFISTCKEWDSQNEYTMNALYAAIVNNNVKIIKLLLANEKIDVNATLYNFKKSGFDKYYPLTTAIQNENIEIIKLIISHPNIDVNKKRKYVSYDEYDHRKTLSMYKTTYLYTACEKNNGEIVKALLNNPNFDVNEYSIIDNYDEKCKMTILNFAIMKKNFEIVKLLLQYPKIDVNKFTIKIKDNQETQLTPLAIAIKESITEIASLLLSNQNIDVNLHFTRYAKDIKMIETPLSLAILYQRMEIIETLLVHPKIDINLMDVYEKPDYFSEKHPLCISIEKNFETISLLLLCCQNIDVNAINLFESKDIKKTYTLLYVAIQHGNIKIIKKILENPKIDVNKRSVFKSCKDKEIIQSELPAWEIALSTKNQEIIQLLISNPDFDANSKIVQNVFMPNTFFIEEKTIFQTAFGLQDTNIILVLFSILKRNKQVNIDFNELMRYTTDNKIKAIIYNEMKNQKL